MSLLKFNFVWRTSLWFLVFKWKHQRGEQNVEGSITSWRGVSGFPHQMSGFPCPDGSTTEMFRARSGPSLAGKVFIVPQQMSGCPVSDCPVEQHQWLQFQGTQLESLNRKEIIRLQKWEFFKLSCYVIRGCCKFHIESVAFRSDRQDLWAWLL